MVFAWRLKMDKKVKSFEDFPEAMDYCQGKNCPVTVLVKGEIWELEPSGNPEKQAL